MNGIYVGNTEKGGKTEVDIVGDTMLGRKDGGMVGEFDGITVGTREGLVVGG